MRYLVDTDWLIDALVGIPEAAATNPLQQPAKPWRREREDELLPDLLAGQPLHYQSHLERGSIQRAKGEVLAHRGGMLLGPPTNVKSPVSHFVTSYGPESPLAVLLRRAFTVCIR